jgi:A/G-specific adenine glycosylase
MERKTSNRLRNGPVKRRADGNRIRQSGYPAIRPLAIQSFRRKLLHWFSRHARDLPWRRTRDPYAVLVSEFMLQQTQVSRVAEYYPRFLARFSSVTALARATPRAVREAWDGLGYYARARNLHALAKAVSGAGGRVPGDPEELIKLPGVGRYTAGAVACFAYEKPVPAVDTNVARVIGRAFVGERPLRIADSGLRNGKAGSRVVWEIAARLVPPDGKRAWRFNQEIMELGALVCTARTPQCGICPVRAVCKTGKNSAGARSASGSPPRGR